MNYYKRHLGDYAKDTRHLSLAEHGAFCLLLDYYYATEKPIPDDRCERIANAYADAERLAVRAVLAEFFMQSPAGWVNRRADSVIAEYNAKSLKAKESAEARWGKTQCERNANASEKECERNASHKPLATNHKEAKAKGIATPSLKPVAPPLPGWVPVSAWADWHAYRNSRKGWTAGARKLSLRTLTNLYEAGQDPTAVIEQSIESGWTKLYPVKSQGSNHANPAKLSAAERVLAHAIEGERADRDRDSAGSYGSPHLVGSDG